MSNVLKEETAIEKHFIGGFGSVIEFIKQSTKYGEWTCTDEDLMDCFKRTSLCDDKTGRKLAIDLTNKIERLIADSNELRKRFVTMGHVINKVNATLKEELESKEV